MDKFVSSLNRCKTNVVLFNPLRKTKYNHLKNKLKGVLAENNLFEQDEIKGKKKLDMQTKLRKLKKSGVHELVTVVDKIEETKLVKQKGRNKLVKQKKKNKSKRNIKQEYVMQKQKRNFKKKAKTYSDSKDEKQIIAEENRNVDVISNQKILGLAYNNEPQEIFPEDVSLEDETYSNLETIANSSHSVNFGVIDMNTTMSPIFVQSKQGPAVTHPMIQDCGKNSYAKYDFNDEFSSVLSCFRKSRKNRNVVLETCKINSPKYEASPNLAKLSSVAKEPKKVRNNSSCFGLHILPSGGCVMTMRHPSEVVVQGKVKVTVVKGAVDVLGFRLTPENSEGGLTVFSPERCRSLSIVSHKLQEEAQDSRYIEKLEALKACYGKLLNECQASDCVLLLQETSCSLTKFLKTHFPIKLFPKVCSGSDREFYKEENRLQCRFELPGLNEGMNHLTRRDEWEQVISDVSMYAVGSKTVVLGGKGVGKSTFLRYLANSCVSSRGAVLWLDFDPGQAEFTVPGCLSAVLVKEPLLGPNFTHQTTPLRVVYLGEVNVVKCPSRYISFVEDIIKYCRSTSDLQDIPWLVNTMGYSKGLGVELAISIIRLLHPTRVIHIESERRAQNFVQPLKSYYVNQYLSTWSSDSAVRDLDYDTHILPSAVRSNTCNAPGLNPRDSRELMVLAYLSQVESGPRCSLLSVVPYRSPLARLKLAVCHEVVERSHVLAAMNGTLVALCSCDDDEPAWSSSDPKMARILWQPPVAPCLGFGIVRGVDIVNKAVYLITPVLGKNLSQVNCLLMGAVSLPPYMYFAVEPGSGLVPYVSKGSEDPMNRATHRTFRHPI